MNIIFYFFTIVLIVILIIFFYTNRKDKYINSEKINNIFKDYFKDDFKHYKNNNKNVGCTTLVSPDYIYKSNGKLKATYEKDLAFEPVLYRKRLKFNTLYIVFMRNFDSEAIPRTFDKTSKDILKLWSKYGERYLITPAEANDTNLYDVPPHYAILDPLETQFIIDESFTVKKAIKTIVEERLQKFINMKLVFMDFEPDFESFDYEQLLDASNIRISFDPNGGCNSYIGKSCEHVDKRKNTMNFEWFDVRTVLHEFGHALGLIHEHQSPLNPIPILNSDWNIPELSEFLNDSFNKEGIDIKDPRYGKIRDEWFIVNVYSKYEKDKVIGEYDEQSIMLYTFPKKVFNVGTVYNSTGLRKNCILSKIDIKVLASLYPEFDASNNPIIKTNDEINDIYNIFYPFAS